MERVVAGFSSRLTDSEGGILGSGTLAPSSKATRSASLKVAIACPGVGLVQRGFERLFADQFHVLENALDVTLFKGGGATSATEKVPLFAARNGALTKILPLHKLFGRTAMHSECLSFALGMLPHIHKGRFDIVHCIDPPLTRVLYKLRALLRMEFRLLYTEGCAMAPQDYPPADHIVQISKASYDDARGHGIAASQMTLLPCGFHPHRFACARTQQELRRAHGVPEDAFVILSVAALNRNHKRVDYLIEEVSRLEGNYLLWLDGSLDHGDAALAEMAKERLGARCRISHVASEKVGELFRMADIQVLCSLFEAFGLAIVEGAAMGLPVLTHNAPHFQWLLPNPACWIDMAAPGALSQRLASVMADRGALAAMTCADSVRRRFAWENLQQEYVATYERMARCAAPVTGGVAPLRS
jgi:glycosyltransferase involved in cell wall biosynthesis